jgi:hypothetical protein
MRRSLLLRSLPFLLLACPLLRAAETADEQLLRQAHIATDGPGLLAFFRTRLPDSTDEKKIKSLIIQLGDESFEKREEASKQLIAMGMRARNALRVAVKDADLEISRRAEDCLQTIEEAGARSVTLSAAVRVLTQRKPEKAAATLLAFLPHAEDDAVVSEIFHALRSLAVHDGKAEPAVVEALTDKIALKRAAAGAALARAHLSDTLPAVRKLLKDPDPNVRLRVALALVAAREAEAVPALVGLLGEPSVREVEVSHIEEFLCRLAEDKAPTLSFGVDAAAHRKYRDAWDKWWRDEGSKLPAARLEEAATKPRGYTLVILLDLGQVVDLDPSNRTRFQLTGLDFPLDVQLLPGERVLAAEYQGNRVTERDRSNKILWEKKIDAPLMAQRLPSGNTFIATNSQLMEVDPSGKEVFSFAPPGGAAVMKAMKLPGGEVACVTGTGFTATARFCRLNTKGEEIKGFDIALRTSGGRIQVLPNGHVIVPEKDQNRVAEYDASGTLVWEAKADQPVAAVRLPSGNTLVTGFTTHAAVEIDPQGKEVWNYRTTSRVTRAFRR